MEAIMSIEFSLKIKEQKLNEEILVEIMNSYERDVNVLHHSDDLIYSSEEWFSSLGFILTFVKNKKAPYNIVDTSFLEKEFKYTQILVFEFDKNQNLPQNYQEAIKIILSVIKKINTQALLSMSSSMDLCFFNSDNVLYVNKDFELWDKLVLNNHLKNWSVIKV